MHAGAQLGIHLPHALSSMQACMAPRVGGPRSYLAYEPGLRLTLWEAQARDAHLAREWKKGTCRSDRSIGRS
jgi:hypothetical protein